MSCLPPCCFWTVDFSEVSCTRSLPEPTEPGWNRSSKSLLMAQCLPHCGLNALALLLLWTRSRVPDALPDAHQGGVLHDAWFPVSGWRQTPGFASPSRHDGHSVPSVFEIFAGPVWLVPCLKGWPGPRVLVHITSPALLLEKQEKAQLGLWSSPPSP